MNEIILLTLPYLALLSHVVLVLLLLSVFYRNSWGRGIVLLVGRNALLLGFLASLTAIMGSLFYSDVIGYEACVLCWWQRVFLYPQFIIFAVAWWKRDLGAFSYSVTLSVLAGIVALYQSYVYWGGASLLPCTAAEGDCSKVYVMEFGYITIPVMSLTLVLYFLMIAWINHKYQSTNDTNTTNSNE